MDVYDIGLCGTEVVYFATFAKEMDGGIMVTASHNPPDYNGMKFVREGSRPISGDTGLQDIRRLAKRAGSRTPARVGERFAVDIMPEYIEHLLSYVDRARLKPLQVVVNAGNGGAGLIVDQLEPYLPFEFVKVQHEPDGTFPNGVPNPMLVENHRAPVEALRRTAPTAPSPGTATSIAASCSTSTAASSRATTSSACSPRCSCSATRAAASSTTRGSPGTRSTSWPRAAARRCSRSPATRSSRR